MLAEACPEIGSWFSGKVKPRYPEIHISCSYRDEAAQNDAVKRGISELQFPNSAHNKLDAQGLPASRALDLFIQEDGKALWPMHIYHDISVSFPDDVKWGGQWKGLGDFDHFEIKEPEISPGPPVPNI